MRRSTAFAFTLALSLSPLAAPAMTFMEIQVICPLDGKPFASRVMGSGTSFGMYFDTQRFGPIASPAPLPACPGNGFIVADESRKYSENELTRLRAFVESAEYRGWIANDTPYYRLAKQMAFLGEPEDAIAGVLLAATWEAGPRYPRYAAEALALWQARALRDAGSERAHAARMLVGELQRRLGRFDEARATFDGLRADRAFPGKQDDAETAAYMRKVVAAQLQLIRARSVAHARLDEDGEIVDF
jgi:hypothetical protein